MLMEFPCTDFCDPSNVHGVVLFWFPNFFEMLKGSANADFFIDSYFKLETERDHKGELKWEGKS